MQTSSPRFKALVVTAGLSFWFFVISSSLNSFSIEFLIIFIIIILTITQILAKKISKGLDVFAYINTKILLGILFVFVISVYGILFAVNVRPKGLIELYFPLRAWYTYQKR